MDVRHLVSVFVVALVSWFAASAAVLYSVKESREERRALVRFVCAAIEVAEEQQTPEALRRASRFREILDSIEESCD